MNGTIQYTIRPYDTIWMLAQVFNTTVDSIMDLNPGIDPRNLFVGQVIKVRPGYQYTPQAPGTQREMATPGRPGTGTPPQGGMTMPSGTGTPPPQGGMTMPMPGGTRTTPPPGGMTMPMPGGTRTTPPPGGMTMPMPDGTRTTPPQGGMTMPMPGGTRTTPPPGGMTMPMPGGTRTTPPPGGMTMPMPGGTRTTPPQGGMTMPMSGGTGTTPQPGGMRSPSGSTGVSDSMTNSDNWGNYDYSGYMNDMNDMNDTSDMNNMDGIDEDLEDLRDYFRMLWSQHVYWTRMAVMGIIYNLPDVQQIQQRLLRNPIDFENALIPFYGRDAAKEFSQLLTDHLSIAAEIVKAAKAGDNKMVNDANNRWHDNADKIAEFIGSINPYWTVEDWSAMIDEHLQLLSDNIARMLAKKYEDSINGFDDIEMQALEMADMMSEGIAMQFSEM